MEKKQTYLKAVEAIDAGLAAAEQITIEDGIRDAIEAGRLTPEIGRACLEAYQRTNNGLSVVERPEPPDEAA